MARLSYLPQCPRERAPFKPQPLPSVHCVEMFSRPCRCAQPELRLHAVEQLVEEDLHAVTRRRVDHVVPRLLPIGYFEGLDAERAIAWRAADSFARRE